MLKYALNAGHRWIPPLLVGPVVPCGSCSGISQEARAFGSSLVAHGLSADDAKTRMALLMLHAGYLDACDGLVERIRWGNLRSRTPRRPRASWMKPKR